MLIGTRSQWQPLTYRRQFRNILYIHILYIILYESRVTCNTFYSYRLDRKSSRGMIYENEELRLRTININAEVERGKC